MVEGYFRNLRFDQGYFWKFGQNEALNGSLYLFQVVIIDI